MAEPHAPDVEPEAGMIATPSTSHASDVTRETWDVAVVGAGPAGAIASMCIASAGRRTLLIDRSSFPRSKVCGGCLGAAGVAALECLGLRSTLDAVSDGEFTRLSITRGGESVDLSVPPGRVVRRALLDEALVREAVEAGAVFLPGATLLRCSLDADGDTRALRLRDSTGEHELRARCAVIATGLGPSRVVDARACATRTSPRSRIGLGAILHVDADRPPRATVDMGVGRDGYVGTVRAGDAIIMGAAMHPEGIRCRGSVAEAVNQVRLDAGLEALDLGASALKGTPCLTHRRREHAGHRVFFIGDAAGYVEPFTGEGMTWAIRSGAAVSDLAGRASSRWDARCVAEWTRWNRRVLGPNQRLCRLVARVLATPTLTTAAMRTLHAFPTLASPVLARMQVRGRTIASGCAR